MARGRTAVGTRLSSTVAPVPSIDSRASPVSGGGSGGEGAPERRLNSTIRSTLGGREGSCAVRPRTKVSSSSPRRELWRRSNPIVELDLPLRPAPPQSDPPMCAGHTST